MGLLQQLAAAAIRNKILAALRENCPTALREPLEALLANSEAVAAIQRFVSSALNHPEELRLEALLALPLPEESGNLLARHPELADYLLATARSRMAHGASFSPSAAAERNS